MTANYNKWVGTFQSLCAVVKMLEISLHSIWLNKSVSPFLFAGMRTMNNEQRTYDFCATSSHFSVSKMNNLSLRTVTSFNCCLIYCVKMTGSDNKFVLKIRIFGDSWFLMHARNIGLKIGVVCTTICRHMYYWMQLSNNCTHNALMMIEHNVNEETNVPICWAMDFWSKRKRVFFFLCWHINELMSEMFAHFIDFKW